ncbi:MAG: Fic family protein [Atopobium sp.]|uniref:Fic family protein n=1 Tax=Atopobium sp. TaxID=1872650 RepID=UPI002A7F7F3F|nr:Fic family protein [Atopobium sp.]MDY4522263.1 Fic family protein [Atopobium sp.]
MQNYQPPYSITSNMMMLASSISEKVGKLEIYQSLHAHPQLRKNNRIKSIHSSLAIEANSLSLDQVKDVIDGNLVLGPAREIQEVKNAYAAYECINSYDPYSLDDLKRAHGVMTQGLLPDAGKFRTGNEGVFNGDTCIFMAPQPHFVPELMTQLFAWMHTNKDTVHPLIISSIFHYEFVFIHPFSDGNGRIARLWHTVLLNTWNPFFEYLPLESQIAKFQAQYYDAIAQCHVHGSSDIFIEFMLQQIDATLDTMLIQNNRAATILPKQVSCLLQAMEWGVAYSAAQLMELVHVKTRNTLRTSYINPALELGLIAPTIPDKPKSKNQRYIKQ